MMSKKKYALSLAIFVVGSALAFKTGAGLGEYTAFATMLLGTFALADVADKKLNGGSYSA